MIYLIFGSIFKFYLKRSLEKILELSFKEHLQKNSVKIFLVNVELRLKLKLICTVHFL